MCRWTSAWWVVIVVGCQNPGDQTLSEAIALTDHLVSLVETHRCDPEGLEAAVTAFAVETQAKVETLALASSDLQRAMSAADRRALSERWVAARDRLSERVAAARCDR